eukprot:TRINITY_DN1813_c1_g1_i1.p7 TRINITY_DN1813_c1_g1~~TRINITY_DN1813_c1_g1_i1.p7  ORF type:complete len:100 (-),score=2.39 TRINITY_DN1813_c1_g1_i1:23-322(-)
MYQYIIYIFSLPEKKVQILKLRIVLLRGIVTTMRSFIDEWGEKIGKFKRRRIVLTVDGFVSTWFDLVPEMILSFGTIFDQEAVNNVCKVGSLFVKFQWP